MVVLMWHAQQCDTATNFANNFVEFLRHYKAIFGKALTRVPGAQGKEKKSDVEKIVSG
jgi:hypothetical protein